MKLGVGAGVVSVSVVAALVYRYRFASFVRPEKLHAAAVRMIEKDSSCRSKLRRELMFTEDLAGDTFSTSCERGTSCFSDPDTLSVFKVETTRKAPAVPEINPMMTVLRRFFICICLVEVEQILCSSV